MQSLAEIEDWIERWTFDDAAPFGAAAPRQLLQAGEDILCHWLIAHEQVPTNDLHEGFRLIALHRLAARGDPSFNACRETCREACYRFNLAATELSPAEWRNNLATLRRVVQHLSYFIGGKMRNAQIGEFCCAARPIRSHDTTTMLQSENRA